MAKLLPELDSDEHSPGYGGLGAGVFTERNLYRHLRTFVDYYHWTRVHLALKKDTPEPRPIQPPACGGIVSIPVLGGLQEKDMDEIMYTCPWFPATNMPKPPRPTWCSWGSGGWQVPRSGVKVGRERRTTCLTVSEIEKIGVDKTIEIGLQMAFVEGGPPNAVIDVIDLTVRPKIGRFPLPFHPKK